MIRKFTLSLLVLIVFQSGVAQKKDNPLRDIDIIKVNMHYDWANFAKYDKQNQEVDMDNNEGRVVFMGNSITEGWVGNMPDMFDNQTYINRGISGQTTPQMLVRFRSDVINLKPKLVVILAGTNDIAGNTLLKDLETVAGHLFSMAELAMENNIKVILCSVLPAAVYPWRPEKKPDIEIPRLNNMIENYARQQGIYYLDYFSAMTDGKNGLKKNYGYDGVHPNKEGYELMRKMIEKAIKKVL